MICDLHTRIWERDDELGTTVAEQLRRRRSEPWTARGGNADEHAEAMGTVGVSVIHGFESALLDAHIPPDRVAGHVARHSSKYLGFVGIDPTVPRAVRRLEQAVDDYGLAGATLSPAAAGFHPTDTRAMELFEACEARRLPVLIEHHPLLARQTRIEFSQPFLLDEVARTFSSLKIVLGSCGDPFHDQALTLLGKHPTVFADLADVALRPWPLYNVLSRAHQLGVLPQILFGSGFPDCAPERAIVTLYSVNTLTHGTHLPSIPREALRSIVEADSLSLLGLTAPESESRQPQAPDVNPGPPLERSPGLTSEAWAHSDA